MNKYQRQKSKTTFTISFLGQPTRRDVNDLPRDKDYIDVKNNEMNSATLKSVLYSIVFLLINGAFIIIYFMLPDLNAPKDKWQGQELQLMSYVSNKIFIANTVLLAETLLFNSFIIRKQMSFTIFV